MKFCAVIVAAGASGRMKSSQSKVLLPLLGIPVIRRTLLAFEQTECISDIVVVCRAEDIEQISAQCGCLKKIRAVVPGGADRQESVSNGIRAAGDSDYVAIHDGARPLVSTEAVERVCKAAVLYGAATLAVPAKDTVKLGDEAHFVAHTPNREQVYQIQTPQVFRLEVYQNALRLAEAQGKSYTDDCQLIEQAGGRVYLTEGDYSNIKLTTPEDLALAEGLLQKKEQCRMRIGHGYDVHRLVPGRKLIIGGVEIPHHKGLLGHSDADVLLHAVSDALLGAAGLGDIGGMFPDTDEKYEGADSLLLLREVVTAVAGAGYQVGNLDCTVVAQVPKLKPFVAEMRGNIAAACRVPVEQVNVKATTEEKLGFTGRCEGISAHAVCLIQ